MPKTTKNTKQGEALAAELREWRGETPLASIAPKFGIPLRTLQGIEQGRDFRYPALLRLAMKQIGGRTNGN